MLKFYIIVALMQQQLSAATTALYVQNCLRRPTLTLLATRLRRDCWTHNNNRKWRDGVYTLSRTLQYVRR